LERFAIVPELKFSSKYYEGSDIDSHVGRLVARTTTWLVPFAEVRRLAALELQRRIESGAKEGARPAAPA
jgi:hypothetical protein